MDDDLRQLDLLGTFHYVVAVILALFGCFPIMHLIMGVAIFTGSFGDAEGDMPPAWFGVLFIGMSLIMILGMWFLAVAVGIAGNRLKRHANYTYCFVVAAIACIFVPFGTVLGIFTIIVLSRPSVKALFGVRPGSVASS